jgi:hypothetical protein
LAVGRWTRVQAGRTSEAGTIEDDANGREDMVARVYAAIAP